MVIKKYIVKNMNEAMTRIRYELGKDAIIISQRKVKEPGIKGFFTPKLIEVTAAIENTKIKVKEEEKRFKESLDSFKKLIVNDEDKKEIKDDNISNEVKEMKELLNQVIQNTTKEEKIDSRESYLRELDIDDKYISDLKEFIHENSEEEMKESFKEYLNDNIQIDSKDLAGRIVLVGPTGVGKTTTIAKLAGKLSLIDKKKVGLITIDTYRIGAVEQLKTYAEIMNIDFKVVITIKEMEEAVNSMKDLDVVLIDTTGRSSKNNMQISELRAFINKAEPDDILLVISAITKNKDISIILDGYSEVNYKSLIVTKLDETSIYGGLYNIIKEANKPIRYITTGQNVPDDIKVPNKEEIIELILGESSIC